VSQSFRIYQLNDAPLKFPGIQLDSAARTRVGLYSIALMQERLDRFQNLNDQPALPYSPRGPIYVPIFGAGRSKKSLKGAFGFSAKDVKAMRDRGLVVVDERVHLLVRYAPSSSA
jgi:hypothetical protein